MRDVTLTGREGPSGLPRPFSTRILRGAARLGLALLLYAASGHAAQGAVTLPAPAPGAAACRADAGPLPPLPAENASLEETVLSLSDRGCGETSGRPFDREAVKAEVSRIADRVLARIGNDREPHRALAAIARVVYGEDHYVYAPSGTDPDLYLLDRVVARKRGNCLGLTLLYALVGERIGLPLTGSYIPGHILVRYDAGGVRINVETSREGRELPDDEYRRVFRLGGSRPYLRTLDRKGLSAVFVKTVGASCACGRRDEQALRLYEEARRLHPELAVVYFNAGVSLQRLGRSGEAADEYRKCLSIDPGLAAAQRNLDRATRREAGTCDFRRPPAGAGGTGGNGAD